MSNLSQGIEDKAIAMIVMNMHKIGYTPERIADAVGVSMEESYTLMTFITSLIIGLCMGSGALFSVDYGA